MDTNAEKYSEEDVLYLRFAICCELRITVAKYEDDLL